MFGYFFSLQRLYCAYFQVYTFIWIGLHTLMFKRHIVTAPLLNFSLKGCFSSPWARCALIRQLMHTWERTTNSQLYHRFYLPASWPSTMNITSTIGSKPKTPSHTLETRSDLHILASGEDAGQWEQKWDRALSSRLNPSKWVLNAMWAFWESAVRTEGRQRGRAVAC